MTREKNNGKFLIRSCFSFRWKLNDTRPYFVCPFYATTFPKLYVSWKNGERWKSLLFHHEEKKQTPLKVSYTSTYPWMCLTYFFCLARGKKTKKFTHIYLYTYKHTFPFMTRSRFWSKFHVRVASAWKKHPFKNDDKNKTKKTKPSW